MKIIKNFKISPKILVAATAVALLFVGASASIGLGRTNSPALSALFSDAHGDKPEPTIAAALNIQESPKSTSAATPKPATPQTAKATPKPGQPLDVRNGPCQGINATDPGCIKKDASAFNIASVILWPSHATCSGNSVTVNFHPMMVTRHYTADGGGTAIIQVDFSDGTSSPVIRLPFTVGGLDVQNYNGLVHTFADKSVVPSYRVRMTSPNPLNIGWQQVYLAGQTPCYGPSPSPSPNYPSMY